MQITLPDHRYGKPIETPDRYAESTYSIDILDHYGGSTYRINIPDQHVESLCRIDTPDQYLIDMLDRVYLIDST